jgi:hypothetical protein
MYGVIDEQEQLDEGMRYRHWSPQSERFSPAETLLSAIDNGWGVHGMVFRQEYWHSPARRVVVYHFKLERDGQLQNMVVVENPFVTRLLRDRALRVVYINQRKDTEVERW